MLASKPIQHPYRLGRSSVGRAGLIDALILLVSLAAMAVPGTAADALFQRLPSGEVLYSGVTYKDLTSFQESAAFRNGGLRCGTEAANPRLAELNSLKGEALIEELGPQDCSLSATVIDAGYVLGAETTWVIPVYFHVIYKTDGTGYVSQQRVLDQMAVLNEDFAGAGGAGLNTRIQFELVETRYYENDTWYNDGAANYQSQIGVSPSTHLNIYTNDAGGGGVLGYATLPQYSAGNSDDGIVMLHSTIGGRDNGFGNYDDGRTLVHEVGHYLGLLHTFQTLATSCGNTYTSGDLVVDTPAQSSPDYGCSAGSSCGVTSAIENFMNYSDDRCMDRFSSEQTNRMICGLANYRPAAFSVVQENLPEPPVFLSTVPGNGGAAVYFAPADGVATGLYHASCSANLPTFEINRSATPGAGIFDGQTTVSAITVTDTGVVTSPTPRVQVDISHTYRGDLVLTLGTPDGGQILLKNYSGADSGADVRGTYPTTLTPVESLDGLIGESVNGNWTLSVRDVYSGDTGTLNSWGLAMTAEGAGSDVSGQSGTSPITLTGMVNGASYTCELSAEVNGVTSNAVSAGTVTPGATPPGVPTVVSVEPQSESLALELAPGSGAAPEGYRVICGGAAVETDSLTATVSGLEDGVTYSCVAVALSSVGGSVPSAAVTGTPETSSGLPIWLLYEATKPN